MLSIDLHIHSINSGHAYGTLQDIIAEALKKKMKMIALTDHGPSMEGTSGPIHFYMGNRSQKRVENLRLLWGMEANLLNGNGDIDLPEDADQRLDFVILGIHYFTPYTDLGKAKNTKALIRAIEKYPKIAFLAHPLHFSCDYEHGPVWEAALAHNVLLELNLSYMTKYAVNGIHEFRKLVDFVKKHDSQFVVNSDAHFLHEIGDDSILDTYREQIGLDDSLIINNDEDKVCRWLNLADV